MALPVLFAPLLPPLPVHFVPDVPCSSPRELASLWQETPQPAGTRCRRRSEASSFPKGPSGAVPAQLPQPPSVPGTLSPSRAVGGFTQPMTPRGKLMTQLPSLKG